MPQRTGLKIAALDYSGTLPLAVTTKNVSRRYKITSGWQPLVCTHLSPPGGMTIPKSLWVGRPGLEKERENNVA